MIVGCSYRPNPYSAVLLLLVRLQLQQGKAEAALTTVDSSLRPALHPRDPIAFLRIALHVHAQCITVGPALQDGGRWTSQQDAHAQHMVGIYDDLLRHKYVLSIMRYWSLVCWFEFHATC